MRTPGTTHHGITNRLFAILVACALAASACGGSSPDDTAEQNSTDDASADSGDSADGDDSGDSAPEATATDVPEPEPTATPTAEPEPSSTQEPATAEPPVEETATQSAGSPEGIDHLALSSVEPSSCRFEEIFPLPVTPTCHLLTVPMDWDEPTDATVTIPIAVFAATEPAGNAPMVYLDGGPGGATLELISLQYDDLVAPFAVDRDVVVFDQRGVGASEPSLYCPETARSDQQTAQVADPVEVELQALYEAAVACRDRLVAEGVDLTTYNSIASANDVEALRLGLDLGAVDVLGISYGTRLGQTYMGMFPDSTRSMVLDSVDPVSGDLVTTFAANAERSFDVMFAACRDDVACNTEYADFEQRYFALVDRLDAEPVTAEVLNGLSGDTETWLVDGNDFLGMTFGALYSQSSFGAMPEVVARAEAGDVSGIEALASIAFTQRDFIAIGMNLSVNCNEELPFVDPTRLDTLAPEDPYYSRFAQFINGQGYIDICELWPSGTAPANEDDVVISDVPTLLMAGSYDPITPPSGMAGIAEGLTTAWAVEFPHEGHAVVPTPCGAEIVRAFWSDPSSEPDSSCIADAPAPVFVPSGDVDVELVSFEVAETGVSLAGLHPASWISQGPGVYVRNQNLLDETLILYANTFGAPTENLVSILASQLELDTFAEVDPYSDGQGRNWRVFEVASEPDTTVVLGVFEGGFDGLFVLMYASDDELAALRTAVFEPGLDAISSATG